MSNLEHLEDRFGSNSASSVAFAISLILTITSYSLSAQPTPEWAESHLANWYTSYNEGDQDGMSMLYAPNAVLVPPEGPAHYGRDAIKQQFATQFSDYDYDCTGSNDGWHELGKLAVVWGHDDCRQVVKATGEQSTYESNWMATFRRLDGLWLIVYETYAPVDPQSN